MRWIVQKRVKLYFFFFHFLSLSSQAICCQLCVNDRQECERVREEKSFCDNFWIFSYFWAENYKFTMGESERKSRKSHENGISQFIAFFGPSLALATINIIFIFFDEFLFWSSLSRIFHVHFSFFSSEIFITNNGEKSNSNLISSRENNSFSLLYSYICVEWWKINVGLWF